jgi:hypothetical protein
MKFNFTGKILVTVISTLSAFAIYACSCSCTESQSNVPDIVLKNSNRFIVSKVGLDFFEKYINPDFQETKKIRSQYDMVYNFQITDKPYVNTKIKFTVDSLGNVLDKENIIGIPDCLSSPEKCNFNIDKEQAVQIAKQNNFKEGIKDWRVEFKWEPQLNQYVWSILSTLEGGQGSFGFRGSGEIMLIDSNSGEILSQKPWKIM